MAGAMGKVNWARVYHAYFQEMVVKGLTDIAYRALGRDAGFSVVASIVEKGAMRGFRVLFEELSRAGISVEKLNLEELLRYEVRCHRYAVDNMKVNFQIFEDVRVEDNGRRYVLETSKCVYSEFASKNPVVCGVCVGLTSGVLRQAGFKVRWVSSPERGKHYCSLPEGERPDYIVYRDPEARLPRCRIVIEKLEC